MHAFDLCKSGFIEHFILRNSTVIKLDRSRPIHKCFIAFYLPYGEWRLFKFFSFSFEFFVFWVCFQKFQCFVFLSSRPYSCPRHLVSKTYFILHAADAIVICMYLKWVRISEINYLSYKNRSNITISFMQPNIVSLLTSRFLISINRKINYFAH